MQISAAVLSWAVGLWLVGIDNVAFWRTLWAGRDTSSARGILALLVLAAMLWALFSLLVRVLCRRRAGKPLLAILLLSAALAAHFIGTYGIVIDKGMIRNVLETDWREATDLVTPQLWLDLALRGLLPAAAVLAVRIEFVRWQAELVDLGKHAALLAMLMLGGAAAFYGDYAAAARNHRELRHLLTPTNVANGFAGLWKDRAKAPVALVQVAGDAARPASDTRDKPLVVVLMVGETARAANFSLGGYARDTNRALSEKDVAYFGDVTACGTDTATSLPCMFSGLGAKRFSVAAAAARENVLDVLQRVGVAVRWLDNNSGCKGVCERSDTQLLNQAAIQGLCDANECLDEVLLEGLRASLANIAADSLIVLHMKGSHGPAYFKRYPPSARRFEPTCDTNQIQRCSREALLNTYDNGIAYSSEVLAQAIDWLAGQSGQMDSALIYLSDHGESLGEANIYLHGLPMLLAPREQTQVPMIAWLSAGAQRRFRVDLAALRGVADAAYSHDNLFHTLLGAFGVQTRDYRPELDLLARARAATGPDSRPGSMPPRPPERK